jgi:hypothetical protein
MLFQYLDNENPNQPIYLYINCPGGSVISGLAIYDTIQHIKSEVVTVNLGISIHRPIYHYIYPSTYLSLYLSIYASSIFLFIHAFIYSFVHSLCMSPNQVQCYYTE